MRGVYFPRITIERKRAEMIAVADERAKLC